MKKIKIKNYTYTIEEVDNKNQEFVNKDGNLKLYGQTIYTEQKIKIYKYLTKERKRETLIHELTHAFWDVYMASYHLKNKFDEEDICCFIASYGEEIIKITDDYFKEEKSEKN